MSQTIDTGRALTLDYGKARSMTGLMDGYMSNRKEGSLLGPYRVLDLSDEKGVLCGKVLADLGADVIKVESPGGDPMRNIGPFYHDIPGPEKSLHWFTFNTSKRSITLDITRPEGREIFKKLVRIADFVLECFPPGYMDSLGLGYEALSKVNPRVVMTSITPFGQTGPYAEYKAYDITGIAMGGLMYLIGEPERPPVRIRASQAYAQVSVQAAAGTMAAHYYRETGGEGQHVDVSMQDAVSNAIDTAQQAWDLQKIIYKRVGHSRPVGERVLRCVYPCKDGYFACWAPEEFKILTDWMTACGIELDQAEVKKWIEITEKMKAEKMSLSAALTQEQVDYLRQFRVPLLNMLTKQELYEGALTREFGWAPVNTPKDLVESPQLAIRDYFTEVEHPELGVTITYPGAPFKLSETPWRIWGRAPLIGEHNEEVYIGEIGMTQEELSKLKQAGVI